MKASTRTAAYNSQRFAVLDGWRGISILCVLAAHMLPLGPKFLHLNEVAGLLGMSLFFTLSGFLITLNLYNRRNIIVFLIRRISRIVPLAFLYLVVIFLISTEPISHLLISMGFLQNYLHFAIMPHAGHFWSLCVEIHFYIGIALLCLVTRFKGFKYIPWILCLLIGWRIFQHVPKNIKTHLRVDEIVSGSCLALLYVQYWGRGVANLIKKVHWIVWLVLLLLSSHQLLIPFPYFRCVFASSLIGHTLLTREEKPWNLLCSRPLKYIATISYALYVWHPLTMYGWLGSGDTVIKYLKRPICFALSFGAAHLSTFCYEMPITRYGRTLSLRFL
jgi:peptidoglycan/LPS O-acetylase OafA/YrhL